jgi:hypothetical protein
VLGGNGHQRIHVRRVTVDVHGHDGHRVGGDVGFDRSRIEIERLALDISEDRNGVQCKMAVALADMVRD